MKQLVLLLFLASQYFAVEQTRTISEEHYQKGMEYYRLNDTDKARSEFLKALETDKTDVNSKNMILNLEREVYREAAGDAFKDVVKELFLKGLVYFRAGEKDKAVSEWEKGLSVSPKNEQLLEFCRLADLKQPEAIKTAGVVKEAGRKKSAKKDVQVEKVDVQKENIPVITTKKSVDGKKVSDLYYEGLKIYRQGNIKKALVIWEQVLKIDPDLSKKRKELIEKAKKELSQGE